jgi:hypothetical protein
VIQQLATTGQHRAMLPGRRNVSCTNQLEKLPELTCHDVALNLTP